MAITPDTNIRLLKCPLSLDNKNQITFTNKQHQTSYFLSLPYIEIEECSYQRKENIIRFPAHIDTIIEYNYVMYQNDNYSDKWFYAYILNMEYKADNLTYITIGTDVYQTWQFDITLKESFVEREHVSTLNDGTGMNLEPENLEFGEPIIANVNNIDELEPCFVIAYSRNPLNDGISSHGVYPAKVNGMPSGLYYYVCGSTALQTKIEQINNGGLGANVITIFSIPIGAIYGFTDNSGNTWTKQYLAGHKNSFGDWIGSFTADPYDINYVGSPNFEGYVPKNNKLYNYPYAYLGIVPPNRKSKNIKI